MSVESIIEDLQNGRLRDPHPAELSQATRLIAAALALDKPPTPAQVANVLGELNDIRRFDQSKVVGDAWHQREEWDPTVQRRYVQALIELGGFDHAERLLAEGLERVSRCADGRAVKERAEYRGLRGRILKQKYVKWGDVNLLSASIEEYLAHYAAKQSYWHGINVVALRMLEEREGLDTRPGESAADLARRVLEQARDARERDGNDSWPLATASEACLALAFAEPRQNWCDRAELWLHRFLAHPAASPFRVESYARQLREIWKGDPASGATCADRLAVIVERHIARTERRWSVNAGQVSVLQRHPESLEKNFSSEKTFTVHDLRHMLALCPNIGCVIDSTGVRLGTGFLMKGAAFGFGEGLVFVTNAHVLSQEVHGALLPSEAQVTFEVESAAANGPVPHAVDKVLFTSEPGKLSAVSEAPGKLDVTIVSLKTLPPDVPGLDYRDSLPLPSPTTKAFVVGHPAAGPLQFSLHDSVLLDVCRNDRLLHYRTPTEPGSSGSPVFNAKWEVIALHHAGSQVAPRLNGVGEYEANEGIALRAIRKHLGALQ